MIKKYNQIAHDCQKQLINYCCSEASVPGVSGVAGPRNGVPGRVAHRARCSVRRARCSVLRLTDSSLSSHWVSVTGPGECREERETKNAPRCLVLNVMISADHSALVFITTTATTTTIK